MKYTITLFKNKTEYARVVIRDSTFTIWARSLGLRFRIHQIVSTTFKHGIVTFTEPEKYSAGKIEIQRKRVMHSDPLFIKELARILRRQFSAYKINIESDGKKHHELRNAVRRKLISFIEDESLRPAASEILRNLEKMSIEQLQEVLKELDDD